MYVWTSCVRILTKSPAIPQQLYKPASRGLSAIAELLVYVPAETHAPTRQSLITLRSGKQNSSCESRGHAWRSYVAIYLSLRSCLRSCGQVLGTPTQGRRIGGMSHRAACGWSHVHVDSGPVRSCTLTWPPGTPSPMPNLVKIAFKNRSRGLPILHCPAEVMHIDF